MLTTDIWGANQSRDYNKNVSWAQTAVNELHNNKLLLLNHANALTIIIKYFVVCIKVKKLP